MLVVDPDLSLNIERKAQEHYAFFRKPNEMNAEWKIVLS